MRASGKCSFILKQLQMGFADWQPSKTRWLRRATTLAERGEVRFKAFCREF